MNARVRRLLFRASALLGGNDRGKIIFYHDVFKHVRNYEHAVTLDDFKRHLEAAGRLGYSVANQVPTEEKTFQVCLDDGYRGAYECKDDFLALGIKPTVYLAVELIGKQGYLTKSEIFELQQAGFRFESHTWSHEYLPMYTDEQLVHQLDDSKKWLSDLLQCEIRQICFPRGLFTHKVYEASLRAGYQELMSSIPGSVDQGVMPKVLPRNLVQGYSPEEFGLVLQGALSVFRHHYFKRHYVA